MENILLSYPRSGNHLVRFFIELLSEIPTYGCKHNLRRDKEIYKNVFSETVPFNISKFDKKDCYFKYHTPPPRNISSNKLILIIRNPKEVLLRQNNYNLRIKGGGGSFESYFKNIDYYNNHTGEKLLLYYEDIITNKQKFINTLYDFLDVNNIEKKNYVLSNIDKLYDLSSKGKNRCWGGINSNTTDHYYKNIPESIKEQFDNYINDKFEKYPFLNEKYNINTIIPIGSNCGTSHYLRRHNMRNIAYPFDWNCASLEMIYNVLNNNFENFLNDIFIGTKINRLYFGDGDDIITTKEMIYPVICKKYNILFPHDFNTIDANYINEVKNKYKRRIERFKNIINSDKMIYLVYCNKQFNLNKWQKSVYNEYNKKILEHYNGNNRDFLNKIKELFKDKQNINIISLDELKAMNLF